MSESNNLDFKICPVCQYQNSMDAEACTKCGARFQAGTTLGVPGNEQLIPSQPLISSKPQPGVFTFYIPGFDQPFKLAIKEDILIGRQQDGLPMPDIDLTPYHGYLAGVSRRHAKIKVIGTEVTLFDLGSSNGTWVNEFKLPPHDNRLLQNGDIIRLGHLLMFIYFQPVEFTEQTLLVRDTRGTFNSGLTTNIFSEGLLHLLTAIQELEVCIGNFQGQPSPEVQIKTANFDEEKALIQIKVVGANLALEISKGEITKRRQELSQNTKTSPATNEETLPSPHSVDLTTLEVLDQTVAELASTVLARLASNDPTDEKIQAFLKRLKPLIKTILTSPFEIIVDPE